MNTRSDLVIQFIENLTVPSGEGEGRPFILREWQKKFIREIYDPTKPNGRRRVRRAILSMARKNGKTALIAALVLVHLVGPEAIRNGEIYSAANDKDQAAEVFKVCRQFIEADEELSELLVVTPTRYNIWCPSNGTKYRAISRDSKTKHGQNPSVIIYDELAQSPKVGKDGVPTLYETLRSSQGARAEPLFFIISTQSHDPDHPLSQVIDRSLAYNEDGTKVDPESVCHLYAAPDDADVMDPKAWEAANPALDDFLSLDFIRGEAENARDTQSYEPTFRNLHLNQRVSPLAGLIHAADWRECGKGDAILVDGEDIYLGLDMATAGLDLCALVAVSAHDGHRVQSWFWKPEDALEKHAKTDDIPYGQLAAKGELLTCKGKVIDAFDVAHKIIELSGRYNVVGLAYDPWRIDLLLKTFDHLGFQAQEGPGPGLRMVRWAQLAKDMSPAIAEFDAAVQTRELRHPNNRLLTWTVLNALVYTFKNGERVLDKDKSKNRIDGAVALTIALGFKMRDRENYSPAHNPWDDPEFSLMKMFG